MQGVQSARGGGGGVTVKTALGHTTVTSSNHLIDLLQVEFYKLRVHTQRCTAYMVDTRRGIS